MTEAIEDTFDTMTEGDAALVEEWLRIRESLAEAEARVRQIKEQRADMALQLQSLLERRGAAGLVTPTHTLTINGKLRTHVPADARDAVTSALSGSREFGPLVKEAFNQNSFEAVVRELYAAARADDPAIDPREVLPQSIRGLVSVYEQPTVSVTKRAKR